MSTPSEELSKTQEEIASLQAREAEVNYHDLCTHREVMASWEECIVSL